MSTTCRKCLLDDGLREVSIDAEGLCDYCAGRKQERWIQRFGVTEERKQALSAEYQGLLEAAARHPGPCQAVLALSGGKDSSYLLYQLAVERGLRVLAVNVRTPFESAVAEKNLQQLTKVIDFDLKVIDPGEEFYRRFYRTLFNNPVQEGYVRSICYVCAPLFTGLVIKTAVEHNAPLVVMGVSPFQPENVFFEWPRETIERDWIPELFKTTEFDDAFRGMFWNPASFPPGTRFPRIIAPLHVLDYDTREVVRVLAAHKILPRKTLSPLKTNCSLNWPMIALDTRLLGRNPYLEEFAAVVRRGQSSRLYWRVISRLVHWLVALRLFKRVEIRRIEKRLGLDFSQCPVRKEDIGRTWVEYP